MVPCSQVSLPVVVVEVAVGSCPWVLRVAWEV